MKLGHVIRKAGFDTYVGGAYEKFSGFDKAGNENRAKILVANGVCFSACAYAFLGGQTREIKNDYSYGVHQFYAKNKEFGAGNAQITTAVLSKYLGEMGIFRNLLDIASMTTSDDIQPIAINLARKLNVDNTVPLKADWELKADEQGRLFMLVIQPQARRNATTALIFMHIDNTVLGSLIYSTIQNFRSPDEIDSAFFRSSMLTFIIGEKRFDIELNENWRRMKPNVYSVDFILPKEIFLNILKVDNFEIQTQWSNAMRDVDPSNQFSAKGFSNCALAILKK